MANLLAGKNYSVFGDPGALPPTIVADGAPAGYVTARKQVQLAYLYHLSPTWRIIPAIARPDNEDFEVIDDDEDVRLRRWPDFILNLRYQTTDAIYDSAQVAVVVRQMGYQGMDDVEHLATGWGVSGNLRFHTRGLDSIRAGVVGGDGLGDYLFGLTGDQVAAVPIGGELVALSNIGAYAGYQFVWTEELVSTVAYGIAAVEERPGLG